MTWARIENNIAIEVIDFDPIGKYHPNIEFVDVPDYVKQGAKLVKDKWVNSADPPEPTLEMISAQKAAIEELAKQQIASNVRLERNKFLNDCDWTQLDDSPITNAQKLAWATYRQELRNIPEQAEFPLDVSWPIKPE